VDESHITVSQVGGCIGETAPVRRPWLTMVCACPACKGARDVRAGGGCDGIAGCGGCGGLL
jgi:hypothetical protein